MSLWKIAWRSIQQRGLASFLTAFSMGLGVALVVGVLVIHAVVEQSFLRGAQGYDVIVGAKGDKLQLILNTVFHLGGSPANIPYSYYEEFVGERGRFLTATETAVPVCTGHDYKGCAVVATTPEMFEAFTYRDGRSYEFAEGENFKAEQHYEAVIGATAARETGLKVGDKFRPVASTPGAEAAGDDGHHEFTIVGRLAHTGTPNDQAIFINIEGFWSCPAHNQGETFGERYLAASNKKPKPEGDHKDEAPKAADKDADKAHDDHDAHEHDAEDAHEHAHGDHDAHEGHDHHHAREITAILVATDQRWNMEAAMALPDVINKENVAQAVWPAREITRLFDGIVGNIQWLLLILAVLVVVVAGIGMLVSIYNSMSDRKREIAIMRALGASRGTVMSVILLESIMLALGGGAMGVLLGHGLIGLLGPMIAEQTSVIVRPWEFKLVELILIPGLIALATLVGYVPAMVAYRTDVAKSLTANP